MAAACLVLCPVRDAVMVTENIPPLQAKAEKMVRDAAAAGANVVLLQVGMVD